MAGHSPSGFSDRTEFMVPSVTISRSCLSVWISTFASSSPKILVDQQDSFWQTGDRPLCSFWSCGCHFRSISLLKLSQCWWLKLRTMRPWVLYMCWGPFGPPGWVYTHYSSNVDGLATPGKVHYCSDGFFSPFCFCMNYILKWPDWFG